MTRRGDKNNISMGNEQTQTPVIRFGSGRVLTAPEEIDYYKAIIKEMEAMNSLLGEVDESGQYNIPENIRKELVKIPKEKLSEDSNFIDSRCSIMGQELYFTIQMGFDEELEEFQASLYINEKVYGYEDISTIKTFVAYISQQDEKDIVSNARKAFNVQEVLSPIGEEDWPKIVLKIQERKDQWLVMNEIDELSSQIYVMRILQLLEKEGSLGQQVIKAYFDQMKLEGLEDVKKPNRYIELRKNLDEIIERFGGDKEVFKQSYERLQEAKKEFAGPVRQIEKMQIKRAIAKAPATKAEPSKGGDKPAAAKKTGGKTAGKKAAKKSAPKAKKAGAKKSAAKKAGGKSKDAGGLAAALKKPVKIKGKEEKAPTAPRVAGKPVEKKAPAPKEEDPTKEEDVEAALTSLATSSTEEKAKEEAIVAETSEETPPAITGASAEEEEHLKEPEELDVDRAADTSEAAPTDIDSVMKTPSRSPEEESAL